MAREHPSDSLEASGKTNGSSPTAPVVTDPPAEQPASDVGESPSTKLAENLRDLIRQEIAASGKPPQSPPRVTASEIAWSSLVVLDGILLISLIPEGWLKDEHVKLLMDKVVPWMCASLAVAAYAAFQSQAKAISSKKGFQYLVAAAALILALFAFPILPFHPKLEPPESLLKVDEAEPARLISNRWLRIQPYQFEVSMAEPLSDIKGRTIHLGVLDLIHDVLTPPAWPVRKSVTFQALRSSVELKIQRLETPFDEQYHHPEELQDLLGLNSPWKVKLTGETLELTNPVQDEGIFGFGVFLPFGTYKATVATAEAESLELPQMTVSMNEPSLIYLYKALKK